MHLTLFSRVAFIAALFLVPVALQSPRKAPSIKMQRELHNALIKKTIEPTTIAELTLNGDRFIPPCLKEALLWYIENPGAYFGSKKLHYLIKNVKQFYRAQKQLLGYNVYSFTNKKAPTVVFAGQDFPESLQLGQAFCLSLIMIHILIRASSLHDKRASKAETHLQKIERKEAKKYDFNNQAKPNYIKRTVESDLKYLMYNLYNGDTSSTEVSSDEDAEEKDSLN